MFVNPLTLVRVRAAACVLALGFCAALRAQSPASDLQSLAAIRVAAEQAVLGLVEAGTSGVHLQATALDARLRLPACARPLGTFANPPRQAQSRVIVRVSCATPAWTLNVPVDVKRTHAVLVLRRAVGRGEQLHASDVSIQSQVLPGLVSPFVSRVEDLGGRFTRRPLPAGAPLAAEALAAALLIHRGQAVTLVARSSGFEVRAPGKAMADAGPHQRVRVQNLNSLKIVEGMAETDGVVRISP
jgi:flagella basal body P-ring formation protein FlgA